MLDFKSPKKESFENESFGERQLCKQKGVKGEEGAEDKALRSSNIQS